jgi:hypothetical protein
MDSPEQWIVTVSLEQRWTEYATAHARLHFPDGTTVEAGAVAGIVNCGEFADAMGRTIHVITADNPGRDVSADANRLAHRRLIERADVLQWEYLPAHGGDPAWTHVEACVAVFGADVDEVLLVGREFHQDAVFEWSVQQWSLIMCDRSMRADFAWQSWTVAPDSVGPLTGREV